MSVTNQQVANRKTQMFKVALNKWQILGVVSCWVYPFDSLSWVV